MSDRESTCCAWRRTLLEWSDLPLRAVLAATFLTHGSQKLFHNLNGFAASLEKLQVPAPHVMAVVASTAEFGGACLMILGLLTRLAAFGHMAVMTVAIMSIHFAQGFQMGVAEGHMVGFEWQLALFCMAFCLLLRGAGPLSLDHLLCRWWMKRREARALNGNK